MSFDRFDEVHVPDQWDDIAARAEGPSRPGFEPGRRRAGMLVAAGAVALGIAGVLWVGLSDGGDLATVGTPADTTRESTAPATTPPPTAPPTTAPWTSAPSATPPIVAPATVADEYPPATTAPPTTEPAAPPFVCTEIAGDPNAVYEHDPALDRFGPVGVVPALSITTGWPPSLTEWSDVARLPGGTAILLQKGLQYQQRDAEPGWSLTVVNDDGAVRWRRCGFGAQARLLSTTYALLLLEYDPLAPAWDPRNTWRVLDLASGVDTGNLDLPRNVDRLFCCTFASESSRLLLFGTSGRTDASGVLEPMHPDDVLTVLDTATMTTTDAPYPPKWYDDVSHGWIQLVEVPGSDGGWILKEFGPRYPLIASVFVDGAWSTETDVIRSVVPVAVFAPDYQRWEGLDPLGESVWIVPDKFAIWQEGPVWSEDGGIDLLSVCDQYQVDADSGRFCDAAGLIGVNGDTGEILWQLAGLRQIVAIGDGYALLTDGSVDLRDGYDTGAWLMIDTATGQPVEGQFWADHETFRTGYSLEEDGMWVARQGGVVFAVNGEHVRVWMPASVSTDTVSVSLPP